MRENKPVKYINFNGSVSAELEDFANQVCHQQIETEREACAKIAERIMQVGEADYAALNDRADRGKFKAALHIRDAIRARSGLEASRQAHTSVWIATTGEYEDYHIAGVAPSRAALIEQIKARYQEVEWIERADDLIGNFEFIQGVQTKHTAVYTLNQYDLLTGEMVA